jgi:hypothetical protein
MAFVPGFTSDVFVSYAHGDNESLLPEDPGWVSCFDQAVRVGLREILGVEPAIWRDTRRLGGELDFPLEIRDAIGRSAALLMVVSPSYLRSRYCQQERGWFQSAAEATGGLHVGSRLRLLKVVKTPEPGDEHRTFLSDSLGFEFYRRAKDEDLFHRFAIGSAEYRDTVDILSQRLAGLLVAMRNQRQPIFVAECTDDLEREHAAISDELSANGYRVTPERMLDDDSSIRGSIEEATLTVHLLGSSYAPRPASQVQAALELRKAVVVWLSSAASASPDKNQTNLIFEVAKKGAGLQRFTFLEKQTIGDLKSIVLNQLKPRREESRPERNGKPQVYLVCDRKEERDNAQAWSIRNAIQKREGFDVVWPESGLPDPGMLRDDHKQKLASCDGVLLYWGAAPDEWFEEIRQDLQLAPRWIRSKPFRSEGIYLAEPRHGLNLEVSGADVFRQRGPFHIEEIEPFLARLRENQGAAV